MTDQEIEDFYMNRDEEDEIARLRKVALAMRDLGIIQYNNDGFAIVLGPKPVDEPEKEPAPEPKGLKALREKARQR